MMISDALATVLELARSHNEDLRTGRDEGLYTEGDPEGNDAAIAMVGAPRYFLIHVWGDVEPELVGPFATEEERDDKALELRRADSEARNGIYPLDVIGATLKVGAYSNGFFWDDDED